LTQLHSLSTSSACVDEVERFCEDYPLEHFQLDMQKLVDVFWECLVIFYNTTERTSYDVLGEERGTDFMDIVARRVVKATVETMFADSDEDVKHDAEEELLNSLCRDNVEYAVLGLYLTPTPIAPRGTANWKFAESVCKIIGRWEGEQQVAAMRLLLGLSVMPLAQQLHANEVLDRLRRLPQCVQELEEHAFKLDLAFLKGLAKGTAEAMLNYFYFLKEKKPDATREDLYIRTITGTPGSPYDHDAAASIVAEARGSLGSTDSGASKLWKVAYHLVQRTYWTREPEARWWGQQGKRSAAMNAIREEVRTVIPEDL